MTLLIATVSRSTVWVCADRRLSFANRSPRDDAKKIVILGTDDGEALIAYAGLGTTRSGTEVSDWMSRAMRGRNMPLEQALGTLAQVAKRKLPRHLHLLGPGRGLGQIMLAPAIVSGQPRLYSMQLSKEQRAYTAVHSRHVGHSLAPKETLVAVAGSGAAHLLRHQTWKRGLLRLVAAFERDRIGSKPVARELASIVANVSRSEPTVGHRSIVVWRTVKKHGHPGGEFRFDGIHEERTERLDLLPQISRGMDLTAVIEAIFPSMMETFEAMRLGHPVDEERHSEAIDARLRNIPVNPDEWLE